MASNLALPGSTATGVQLDSLRIGASRTHGSALQTTVRLTLGAQGSSTMQCLCLGCGQTGSGTAAAAAGLSADYTDRIKKSKVASVNALLAGGNRWFHQAGASGEVPSATALKSLSFSFIDSSAGLNATDANGFQALNSQQRDRVREAFGYLSKLIDVSFTEVASGGDIQYGSNTQANSAGYARYPNEGSQVFMANNQASFAGDWGEGSYAWTTLLHETAHALGLKHPGNYNAGGGGTPGPYLAKGVDHRGNTLMSYNNATNMTRIAYDNGSFSKDTVNAGTFQRFDIAALQYLYGASSSVTAESYSWDAGLAFSNTLWNPNVGSEINLSNHNGLNVVDLRAGKRSSIGIVDPYGNMPFTQAEYAALKSGGKALTSILGKPTYSGQNNLMLAAGSQFTRGIGGSGNDSFIANTLGGYLDGGAGNDRLYWTGGNLDVVGGDGEDTLLLKKVKGAKWTVSEDGSTAILTRTHAKTKVVTTVATVTMAGIESVRHWNGTAMKAVGAALYTAPADPGFSATA